MDERRHAQISTGEDSLRGVYHDIKGVDVVGIADTLLLTVIQTASR